MRFALAIVLLGSMAVRVDRPLSASAFPRSQVSQSGPTPVDWAADDGKRIARLTASGEHIEGTNAVVWMPPDALSRTDRQTLVDGLDRGVAFLRTLIGVHDWQANGHAQITFYISDDPFVSHATGRAAVFIPLARVQHGGAPYLHEAAHELLEERIPAVPDPARAARIGATSPLWLTEGLADYLAQRAANDTAFAEGDIFDVGGLAGADATCANRLNAPVGNTVIAYMGAPGGPAVLFTTDRQTMAPTFYACALSFTKYVVQKIGLADAIGLIPLIPQGGVHSRIQALTGKPIAALRADWLRSIR